MSTTNENAASSFSIVREIVTLLKIGDAGKLESFIRRTVRQLENEKKTLAKNLEILKFNFENEDEKRQDKLEDAKSALEESYLAIDVDLIKTNEAQDSFMNIYLSNIDSAALKVKALEEKAEAAKSAYEKESKAISDQIESLSTRINRISRK